MFSCIFSLLFFPLFLALVMLLAIGLQQWLTSHPWWPPAYLDKACLHHATSAACASLQVPHALQVTPGSSNLEVFWTLIWRWKMSASFPGRPIGHKEDEARGIATWLRTLKTQVVLLSYWTRTCRRGRRCICVSRALGDNSGFLGLTREAVCFWSQVNSSQCKVGFYFILFYSILFYFLSWLLKF